MAEPGPWRDPEVLKRVRGQEQAAVRTSTGSTPTAPTARSACCRLAPALHHHHSSRTGPHALRPWSQQVKQQQEQPVPLEEAMKRLGVGESGGGKPAAAEQQQPVSVAAEAAA